MNEFEILENVPLAPLTTFGVGGAARFFVAVCDEDSLRRGLDFAAERGLKVMILGGGSNVLVSDSGFEGVVIKIEIRGISRAGESVTAGAGEDWDEFCAFCVNERMAGVECLSGIPGTVGATPVQNVGAYGQEVSETIRSVRALDLQSGEIVSLTNGECGFGYRRSRFNTSDRGRFVILDVTYRLRQGGPPKIAYRELQERFPEGNASLAEVRDAVREIRASKGMLVRQGGPDSASAGSFFKNPVVSVGFFERVRTVAEERGSGLVPSFPAGEGLVKIPAAWLIERSGFAKGFRLGNAGLSTVHTLALTNRGGAGAAEIIALRDLVQSTVFSIWGIELEVEPVLVGF